MEEVRQVKLFGARPTYPFAAAATKFIQENQHKRSLITDVRMLKILIEMYGDTPLHTLHNGTLATYIARRRKDGVTVGTINHGLKIVRRILNLAATEWMDDTGKTWIETAPKIKLLPDKEKRQPLPLSFEEQERLFKELPSHLAAMALFAVNTGCRDHEICSLRWDWEVQIPALETSVFIIPSAQVKNSEERLVVLNRVASSIVESQRGKHPTYVFVYNGRSIQRMHNSAWQKARTRAELPTVRVHDLKHTFGRRLRAAGVSFEARQDLLGHKAGRITSHYSAPELAELITAANAVCDAPRGKGSLVVLRRLNVG